MPILLLLLLFQLYIYCDIQYASVTYTDLTASYSVIPKINSTYKYYVPTATSTASTPAFTARLLHKLRLLATNTGLTAAYSVFNVFNSTLEYNTASTCSTTVSTPTFTDRLLRHTLI